MQQLNILLVSDHWITRAALAGLLLKLSLPAEVHEAAEISEAVTLLERRKRLDLVLLDLDTTCHDRLNHIVSVRQKVPEVPLVVLTPRTDRAELLKCVEYGAVGYLAKTTQPEEMLAALERVLTGEVALPQRLFLNTGANGSNAMSDDDDYIRVSAQFDGLTPRQRQVLSHLAQGASNAQIAEALGLSINTVRVHLQSITSKLGIRNRTVISAYAARWQGHRLRSVA